MPEPVDRNPDLDTAVDLLRRDSMTVFAHEDRGQWVEVDPSALHLVLDTLAEYRARRSTGGPPPPMTPRWEAVDSVPETAPSVDVECPVRCSVLCASCTRLAQETARG